MTSTLASDAPRSRIARLLVAAVLALLVILACVVPRLVLGTRKGLWVDEVFSLAMATGHSLEHPAARARPSMGDFVEPRDAVPAREFSGYTQHVQSAAVEPARIVRAVFLSDTSPPLYYLMLGIWTRVFGTTDAALRMFSAAFALACFPLLWIIGCRVGGSVTAWLACALFAASPIALYYSAEGRMYALVWFWSLLLAWATLALRQRGPVFVVLLLWTIVGAAGLLTHYFFAFVWIAAAGWLWLVRGAMSRTRVLAATAVVALLVSPWYLRVPESLHQWRVTNGWLNHRLTATQLIVAPLSLAWSMFSGNGDWGASRRAPWLVAALLTLLAAWALIRGLLSRSSRRPSPVLSRAASSAAYRGAARWFSSASVLLWLWLLGSVTGPAVFDLLRGTSASHIARYALAGLPAALVLLALGIALLPHAARLLFVALLVVAWSPGLRDVFSQPSRRWEPFPEMAQALSTWHASEPAAGADLVIVQGIPSSVIGLARYMQTALPIASWIVQLGQRSGESDMRRITAGRCRVALVKAHALGLRAEAQDWLEQHAAPARRDHIGSEADIRYYDLNSVATVGAAAARCGAGTALPRQSVAGVPAPL